MEAEVELELREAPPPPLSLDFSHGVKLFIIVLNTCPLFGGNRALAFGWALESENWFSISWGKSNRVSFPVVKRGKETEREREYGNRQSE